MQDLSAFQHPRFARMYERLSAEAERHGMTGLRRRLLSGLSGRVVEVGAGNGLNFPHYPPQVSEVVAIEPEDRLRALGERAAALAPVPVTVVRGHGGSLPYEAGSFDAAVVSLVLCSVPDSGVLLAELRRVLKPGGELRFFEHVRSANPVRGVLQDLITPLWRLVAGDCRPNRDTGAAIREAGFVIEDSDRFTHKATPKAPALTHILGRARRP
ncbi:class I SAM-dependent methyltransferase [Nonomuraea sp. CA-143628]|uniref:class I SAM-dependent methyltransferase n=1 Tax=Nonomuraea sp. CA-143628 TaxID=3239997 RepID=UPI003D89E4A3